MHHAASGKRIQHGVVRDGVARDSSLLHLLVDCHHLVMLPRHGEALHDGGVDDSVHQIPLRILGPDIIHDLPSLTNIVVGHECLHHASKRDGGQLHVPGAHVAPKILHSRHIMCLPEGLHHAAIRRTRDLNWLLPRGHPPEAIPQQLQIPTADAGIGNGAKQYLVHGDLAGIAQLENLPELLAVGAPRDAFQEDGACDGVGADPLVLHLFHQAPRRTAISLLDDGVQQGMVGHSTRQQTGLCHVTEDAVGRLGVAGSKVSFHDGVVADNVRQGLLLHLLEELKGTRQVATLDAGIQQAVVDKNCQSAALL
mmetsp:Transcript_37488/g.88070  ORF Transcript_37488/g.88070 Transcript_37488/m.88070 type:complete len:310 (-) Transcript_37488:995-1924(-)